MAGLAIGIQACLTTTVWAQAAAADTDKRYTLQYMLVMLLVALGILPVTRSSRRSQDLPVRG